MSFKNPVQSLRDIVDAITSIVEFTSGMDFVGFQSDAKTVAAVERKLLVSARPRSASAITVQRSARISLGPGYTEQIRGTGNWIRHQYERINLEDIWRTVTDDLPPLKASTERALASPPAG